MESVINSYVKRLNSLDDWYVAKVSVNQSYFEIYMEANNKNMVCRITSPTYWRVKQWIVSICNTDEFDGQWGKSSLSLCIDSFSEVEHQINQINTDIKLKFINKCNCLVAYKDV